MRYRAAGLGGNTKAQSRKPFAGAFHGPRLLEIYERLDGVLAFLKDHNKIVQDAEGIRLAEPDC